MLQGNLPCQQVLASFWQSRLMAAPCSPMVQSSSETFFRKFRFWDGGGQDAPPVFEVDGIHYLHVKVRRELCVLFGQHSL